MAGAGNLSLQSPSFCCSRLVQPCLMSKELLYTGISQGGQIVGITSFPEKYPPWCDSDLRAANSSHTAWDRGATEIRQASGTQGDNTQLPHSRFLLLTPGRSFRNGAGEGSMASLGMCRYRSRHIVHINVYIGTSATSFLALFSSQIL